MADRRNDESGPLAPRRSLGGQAASSSGDDGTAARRSPIERVTTAVKPPSARHQPSGPPTQPTSRVDAEQPARERAGKQARSGAAPQRPGPSRPSERQRPITQPSRTRGRGTRKAHLRLTRIDPWSVMKTAFLLSIAFGIVSVIAVAVIWSVLGAAGVWDSINQTVAQVLGGDAGSKFDVQNYVGASRVMGFTMIVAVVDVVLVTAIATLGAFLYNLAAALLGGLEVTLAEDE